MPHPPHRPRPRSRGGWLGCVCVALTAFGVLSADGQTPPGLISGSVLETELGYPVSGASVVVEGTGLSATTDNEGRFQLENVAPGTYTITVSREGFIGESFRDRLVRGGEVTRLELALTAKVIEFETFVVLPEEEREDTSVLTIDTPDSLGSIASVLGADFLAKAGASDAGEALAKVSGASVADSRYVVIRGLSDRYNVVVLNGARVPSSDPDRRAVNIDIFPGNLIENLVVQKTFSPELPGESTGGYVNIVTRAIPKENFARISFGVGYNHMASENERFLRNRSGGGTGGLGTYRDRQMPGYLRSVGDSGVVVSRTTAPTNGAKSSDLFSAGSVTRARSPVDSKFSASAGAKGEFFGSPLGIIASLSYSKNFRYDDDQFQQKAKLSAGRKLLTSQQLIEQATEELLVGGLISVGWQPRDRDLVKLTYFGNIAAEDLAQYSLGVGRPLVDQGSGIQPEEGIIDILRGVAEGGSGQILEREVSQYVERQLHTWQAAGTHFFDEDEFNWSAAYSRSFQDEPEVKITNIIKNLPAGTYQTIDQDFVGSPIDRIWRRIDDQNYFLKLDHAMQLAGKKDEAGSARLHFGGSFDQSSRNFRADTFSFNSNRSTRRFVPAPENEALDKVNLTYADQLVQWFDDPTRLVAADSIRRIASPDLYEASQTILGGFFATAIHLTEDLSTSMGLRAEEYRQFVDTNTTLLPDSYPTVVRTLVENAPRPLIKAQTDYMPQIAGNWKVSDTFNVSSVFARTVARPSFKEIAPTALRVITEPGQFFVGNPDLVTSTISNYDLRMEWVRPEKSESYALTGFSKFIDKPIEFRTSPEVDQFQNAEEGVVWGWELEASKRFEDIALIRDVTLSGNFAQIFSAVRLLENGDDFTSRRANGLDTNRRLQGQPDYILNVNAVYDNKDGGYFVGLFLNITGQLLAAGGSGSPSDYELDILQMPSTSLDFGISKDLTETWKIGFRAENLLDSAREFRYSDGTLRSISHSGINYSVTFSGSW